VTERDSDSSGREYAPEDARCVCGDPDCTAWYLDGTETEED